MEKCIGNILFRNIKPKVGLFLQNSRIKHVAHHFIFLKHGSSAFGDHQILKIQTSQWKSFVRLAVLQGILAKSH